MTYEKQPSSFAASANSPRRTPGFEGNSSSNSDGTLQAQDISKPIKPGRKWGKFVFRPYDDNAEQDWWFASTAVPLIAATVGPLANVLSIAALVVSWRMNRVAPVAGQIRSSETLCRDNWDGQMSSLVPELQGFGFGDPHWCYKLNIVSLVCGFVGNFFLLANFTSRIRYIIALPATIILWYISTALLIGITISMNIYAAPERPCQTYTQGFWYAVIAAVLYLISSMILMVNMLGYFLSHYPQQFILTESQRTLILQTMLFFIWLAGGAGVFAKVETSIGHQGWLFTDALYFCDVTILTVGFGDLVPANDVGRGLVFPYSVGGIIMLGLVIESISKFAGEMSQENVVKKRVDTQRLRTIERSGTARDLDINNLKEDSSGLRSRHSNGQIVHSRVKKTNKLNFAATPHALTPKRARKSRTLVLREEKDRFDAMRAIQHSTTTFKNYTALTVSVLAFCILWLAGAAVFYVTERETQGLSYFQALYFCYVSLLTVGYGDLAPKSNAGRPFFIVWSLLAVPAMTILISDMGSTVINKFKSGTNSLADFTVLPKYGVWRQILDRNPWLLLRLQHYEAKKATKKRLAAGFETGSDTQEAFDEEGNADNTTAEEAGTGPDDSTDARPTIRHSPPTLDELAKSDNVPPAEHEARLARELADAIRRTALDLQNDPNKQYSYEEWVELTEVIRFTSKRRRRRYMHLVYGEKAFERNDVGGVPEAIVDADDEEEDLIEWDWIGENSPMIAGKSEVRFVMERLCESLARYMRWAGGGGGGGLPQGLGIPSAGVDSLRGKGVEAVDDGKGVAVGDCARIGQG